MPEDEAISFLLSHAFPGRRRIVRPLTPAERRLIRLAGWASSVNERMTLLDPVWRAITEPVEGTARSSPVLIQVAEYGGRWAYPLYGEGGTTRVRPAGGMPVSRLNGQGRAERIELCTARRARRR
ncbi:MAG: hypothetical protein HY704_04655 [Gemmatimonadetes bacterium]|nr:hypothetical protein [Gemmatimonadota bacterium]